MGEKACLHILFGTYSGLAPLIYVLVLLRRDFHVSIQLTITVDSFLMYECNYLLNI